jgi:integrase/recombinase XerD
LSGVRRQIDADLLTSAEVERLISACSRRAPTGIRNAALLAVLWRCGLRAGEVVALAAKDVELDEGRLVVQNGKGGRRRVVGIDAGTRALIEQWLGRRRKLGIPGRVLFCTLSGGSLQTSYLRHLMPRLARKAGIERRCHPHALRHRFAVDLVSEGASLTTVRDLLGHSSAATTSVYLSRIGASEAVEFARQREWGGAR